MADTYLSRDAYERLEAELDQLKTVERPRISVQIGEARAHGDIRENAEYHAAKDEQGRIEARIRQLEALLREARVGGPENTEVVRPGLVVVLDVAGDEETYLLGSRENEHGDLEILSSESPMGQAILGARVGDVAEFEAPSGASLEVSVREIRSV